MLRNVQRPIELNGGVSAFPAQTPTLPPATHTNSYALGQRELLLVEPATPYDDERRAWLDWARGLASAGREPVALFLTHHHADHVGGAVFLASELGLPIWAHELTAERLPELPVARRLCDGDVLDLAGPAPQRWHVLHTPGHAPGHLCLHEPELKMLIVGDMIASVGTILIEPNDGDMIAYLDQLERLAALEADVALPAHGDPIETPSERLRFYVQHRLMRERKVLDALRAAGSDGATPDDLVPSAYADTPEAAWPLARMSLRAHLIKLERDGVARSSGGRYAVA